MVMIELAETDEGVILPVHSHPKARRTGVTGVHAGNLKIAVTEPPEKGKANEAVGRVLAEFLGVRPSRVQLIAGAASPLKRFVVTGLTLSAVRDLLEQRGLKMS